MQYLQSAFPTVFLTVPGVARCAPRFYFLGEPSLYVKKTVSRTRIKHVGVISLKSHVQDLLDLQNSEAESNRSIVIFR